jgi:hypothetical protein
MQEVIAFYVPCPLEASKHDDPGWGIEDANFKGPVFVTASRGNPLVTNTCDSDRCTELAPGESSKYLQIQR